MIQSNSALHISGVADGTRVEVYSMTGARVASMNVTGGTVTIPTGLRKGTIAVVRIGDTAMKIFDAVRLDNKTLKAKPSLPGQLSYYTMIVGFAFGEVMRICGKIAIATTLHLAIPKGNP